MAFNLKTATPGSAAASALVFGADSQSDTDPKVYNTTGSGAVALATSPTLTTPTIGVATATSINKVAITAPATSATLTIANGKTLTANNTLTFAGTDGTTMTFPGTSGTVATLSYANLFTAAQTFQPGSDAQAGTFRRYDATQTNNIVEIQTEANAFLAAFDKLGALTIGAASGNTGAVKLKGTTSGTVTLSTADAAGTWTLKLPTSGGTNGYVLSTDGSGNTSWVAQSGGSSTLTVNSTATSGGAAGQLMYDDGSKLQESSSLVWDNTAKKLTVSGLGTGGSTALSTLSVVGGSFGLSGDISANAWTTSGIRYANAAATLLDKTSSGTVAAAYTDVFGGNTLTASSATTYTDYATMYIAGPTASTNVTLANSWALRLGSGLKFTTSALVNEASNTLALRNGTSAQQFRVYNTLASAGNYELFAVDWQTTANVCLIGTVNAGTGTARNMALVSAGGIIGIGGSTSSYPALKRSSAVLAVRLADDSADAALSCGTPTASATALNVTGTSGNSIMSVTNTTTGDLFSVVNGSGATLFNVNDTVTTGTQVLGTSFGLSGNISASAWTTSGIRYRNAAATLTDTSSSGIVATAYTDVFGGNTIAASSSTTYTNYATFRISGPAAGTNVTFASAWALSLGGGLQIDDAYNIAVGTTTGTKIGTATSQKIGFWNATPIVQPTTGGAAASVASTGTGDVVAASTTFDGYTIPQIVKALRNAGLLA